MDAAERAVTTLSHLEYVRVGRYFDRTFYCAQYPDIARAGVDPFDHFLSTGWREGRNPSAAFKTREYLRAYPDVARLGMNPLVHFALYGKREGRRPAPFSEATDAERALVATEFDAEYYRSTYGLPAGIEALEDFLTAGWPAGRDPNASFSTKGYVERYPDVERFGNPFVHYLAYGRREGRSPGREVDYRVTMLREARTLDELVVEARAVAAEVLVAGSERLASALAGLAADRRSGWAITVSQDDYTQRLGGIQLCLRREAAALARRGVRRLHLSPAVPLPCNELDREEYALNVLLDGEPVGTFSSTAVRSALAEAAPRFTQPGFVVVHSLLGHNATTVERIVRDAGITRGFVWTHDFGTVCSGWNLLRDGIEYCGGPPAGSQACTVCTFGATRVAQADQATALFGAGNVTVVAPSQCMLDMWLRVSGRSPATTAVHPHCTLEARVPRRFARGSGGPLRIAFLGFPAAHKGWPVFSRLVRAFAADDRYEFHHLGTPSRDALPVVFTPVVATVDDPSAMARAVEDLEIDVALIWSICPESFCFTAHEGLAGGAAVITNPDSGNVADLARRLQAIGNGHVFADVGALEEALASGAMQAFERTRRTAELFDLRFSALTADLLEAEPA